MKWEIEEIEAVLERIWDLHDKLSEAIHSVSRAHFLNSVKFRRNSDKKRRPRTNDAAAADENRAGYVYLKDFRVGHDDDLAVREAKSLNAIRTALENLEDQLEFFHTLQVQQRAERDAAIARLEQSRIALATRLSEHHGKKYQFIEEALAFVGDVCDASRLVSPESLYGPPISPSGEKLVASKGKKRNILIRFLISSITFVKKTLKLDNTVGILGNAALVALSMIALVHLNQVGIKEHPQKLEDKIYINRNVRKTSPSIGHYSNLDVLLARG
ncbi:plastid division protein PDV1-like [Pyrus ussuriensis x Pyrus communis]|uniref:Plastid division protein PDV1-like n=1 Tax=Pyrus ussuriensis x Pyrus communis TaxID=2448454 RepID=A0A5N5F6Q8_9ROSA|nr:plastid division protein PDV1-like [Pyrus ussuriensis x Pyrus communis]